MWVWHILLKNKGLSYYPPTCLCHDIQLLLFTIKEVSHDTVVGIKNDPRGRGISNSFDTWHGKRALF